MQISKIITELERTLNPDRPNSISQSTVAKENNKTFRIENKGEETHIVIKIQVDNGLICSKSCLKCDYAFVVYTKKEYYFVELKSDDINHAYNQIVKTIEYFKSKIPIQKSQIEGFIVSTSIPKHANLKFLGLTAKFKRDYGKDLIKQTDQYKKII